MLLLQTIRLIITANPVWPSHLCLGTSPTHKNTLSYVHVEMLAQGLGWGSSGLDTRVSTTTLGVSAMGYVVTTC